MSSIVSRWWVIQYTDIKRPQTKGLGGANLGGALLAENLAAASAVVLAIDDAKARTAAEADLAFHPVRGLLRHKHGRSLPVSAVGEKVAVTEFNRTVRESKESV